MNFNLNLYQKKFPPEVAQNGWVNIFKLLFHSKKCPPYLTPTKNQQWTNGELLRILLRNVRSKRSPCNFTIYELSTDARFSQSSKDSQSIFDSWVDTIPHQFTTSMIFYLFV